MARIKLRISLYGEDELIKRFGTTDVDIVVFGEYMSKLFDSWNYELKVKYTSDNLSLVYSEMKQLGRFNVIYQIQTLNHESYIVIKAKRSEDLTFLRLKYGW